MSDQAFLIIGVFGTFLAVALTGVTVITVSRGRRSAQVLQGQLESAGIHVASHGAAASFSERVVAPGVARFSHMAAKVTPKGLRKGVARRLVLAGGAGRWTAEVFLAAQLAFTLGAAAVGFLV